MSRPTIDLSPLNRKPRKVLRYEIEFLTPMFGGGVEPQAPKGDPLTYVRGSSIRGQLRFWWRATQAARFDSSREMFKEEARLFGGAMDHSRKDKQGSRAVALRVISSGLDPKSVKPHGAVKYAAFPLHEDKKVKDVAKLAGSFIVELHCPDALDDSDVHSLKAAVWAWVHFGGLGGRTRRGFGALAFAEWSLDVLPWDPTEGLGCEWVSTGERLPPKHCPSLSPASGAQLFLFDAGNADQAWHGLIQKLQNFRQGKGMGRNEGQGPRPGRSRWPEPDLIRHDLEKRGPIGSPNHHQRISNLACAPRAAFGMPIIFELRGERIKVTMEFDGENRDRMASPLILRPIRTSDGMKAGILILGNRLPLEGVAMSGTGLNGSKKVRAVLEPGEEYWGKNSPMAGRGSDPLSAFAKYCQDNW